MNTFAHARRTVFGLVVAALLLAGGVFAVVSASTLKPVAGHTGQAHALRAARQAPPASIKAMLSGPNFRPAHTKNWWPHLANGRLLQPNKLTPFLSGKHAHSARALAAGINPSPILIPAGVQTFDVFAPPPSFIPPTGPLAYINKHPVWTQDGSQFIFFSSNRPGVNGNDGHYHIWAAAGGGGQVVQITSGAGNEDFPSLNSADTILVFVSTANALTISSAPNANPNRYDLYLLNNPLTLGGPVDVGTLDGLTNSLTQGDTQFTTVGRPALSQNGTAVVFAAHTAVGSPGNNAYHVTDRDHLYFLLTGNKGFDANHAHVPAQLTDGAANDNNPAWSQDDNFIAFDSTASSFANTTDAISGSTSTSVSTGNNSLHGIFVIGAKSTTLGKVPSQLNGNTNGRMTPSGADDIDPAWSFNQPDDYFNQNSGQQYLTFARTTGNGLHGIFYFLAIVNSAATSNLPVLTAEDDTGGANTNTNYNPSIQLNTDDYDPNAPPNPNNRGLYANLFDNTYPAWAPFFQGIFDIVYQSPRSVTYNTPATNVPTETALNLLPGTNGVDPSYVGLLNSQVINVDPPSMLRYSGSEVIAVRRSDANGNILDTTPTRFISPSVAGGTANYAKFIVRLSNREAGVDDLTAPNGGPNVYLQIKDPDGKYQDNQGAGNPGLEHKVFANVNDVDTTGTFLNSGSSLRLFNPGGQGNTVINGGSNQQVGAVAGLDGGNNLSIGHIRTGNGTNAPGNRSYANYQRWGPEYECQFLDPQNPNPDVTAGYGVPYYLAGVDDVTPFSGGFKPPRPVAQVGAAPAEYLQFQKLPDTDQDGLGGVLYGATYRTPTSPSDFYLDVVAYDKAKFPYQTQLGTGITAILPTIQNGNGTVSTFQGDVQNWRIYDNVGGFTTQQFDGSNDILVVSDYALGQKFALSTFGGATSTNLIPSLYGAESYYTDVDVSLLPNGVDAFTTDANGNPLAFTQKLEVQNNTKGYQNGLGVYSYLDGLINDGGTVTATGTNLPGNPGTVSFVRSQKYSIWRIPCRGPIDTQTLSGFQPTFVPQPAVNDTINGVVSAANPNVPVATKCVIWISPYTGDLPLVDAGSLENLGTQQTIQNFVNGGGRICITGQDVAAALSIQNPNSNNGLLQTLGAAFRNDAGGSQLLTGNGNRITGFSGGPLDFSVLTNNFGTAQRQPSVGPLRLGNSFGNFPTPNTNSRADASLDQTNFGLRASAAKIDTITPAAGTITDILTNGQAGLLYHENYTTANGQFDGTRSTGFGSRLVFGSFGLEGVSQDIYRFSDATGGAHYSVNNYRSKILHNIVNYFRTGTFSGRITQSNGTGVSGATVYFRPTAGIPNPRPFQIFSGTTAFNGNYTISGIEPGTYTVTAYATGFTTSSSNPGITFGIEGDTTVTGINLTLTPQPAGSIAGTVTDATTGKPLAGASITFKSTNGQVTVGPVISKSDGTYSIDNVPVGSYNGTATAAPRYAPASPTQGNPVSVVSGQTTPADFALTPNPATITGTVFNDLNASGLPRDGGEPGLAGANVTFTSSDGKTTFGPFTTDANGNYTATVTTPGTYTVLAKKATFEQQFTITIVLDFGDVKTQDVPLVFIPPGSLTGQVTNSVTGAGVAGATVNFVSTTDSAVTFTTTTDANGNYSIANVPRGTYNGTASHQPDYLDAAAPVQGNPISVPSNAPATANFQLIPKGALSGKVTDSVTGAGLANATVTFVSTDGTITLTATTDANGAYAIPNVVPTTYNGTATIPPNYTDAAAPVQGNPITVPPGAGAQADFRPVPIPGTVSGTVYYDPNDNAVKDAGETGLDGATVVFTPTQFGAAATATTANGGLYTVLLVEGTYTVTATKAGYRDLHPFTITVGPNGVNTGVDVPLIIPPGTLGGLVADSFTGQPLAGAVVTITDANGNAVTPLPNSGSLTTSGTTTTGPDGSPLNYGPVRLLPGTYTVTVNPPSGYFQATRTGIVVSSDAFTRVDFAAATGVQPLHVFPAGLNFFSVPYDYASAGVSTDQVFGVLNQGTFLTNPPVYNPPTANRSHLFVYRPELLQYIVDPTPPADGLHLGQGYWIYLRNGREINFSIAPPASTVIPVGLRRGWNMIGVPSTSAVSLSRLTFANPAGTGPITFDQAASNTYKIVSPTLYGYSQSSNTYFQVTTGAALQPWQAYWIYAYVDATVQIPTTGG